LRIVWHLWLLIYACAGVCLRVVWHLWLLICACAGALLRWSAEAESEATVRHLSEVGLEVTLRWTLRRPVTSTRRRRCARRLTHVRAVTRKVAAGRSESATATTLRLLKYLLDRRSSSRASNAIVAAHRGVIGCLSLSHHHHGHHRRWAELRKPKECLHALMNVVARSVLIFALHNIWCHLRWLLHAARSTHRSQCGNLGSMTVIVHFCKATWRRRRRSALKSTLRSALRSTHLRRSSSWRTILCAGA